MTEAAIQHTPGPWELVPTVHSDRKHIFYPGPMNAYYVGTLISGSSSDLALFKANAHLIAAAPVMHDALLCADLEKAHDTLSDLLEDEDAGNDDIRDAALVMCDALNAFWLQRDAALATARGQS
jgi:hypothetical protein